MENTMEPVKAPIHEAYCILTMAKEHCLRSIELAEVTTVLLTYIRFLKLAKLLLNVE